MPIYMDRHEIPKEVSAEHVANTIAILDSDSFFSDNKNM